MIRVNLLPHREEKRKARRTQFYAMTGLVVVLAGVIWLFGFLTIGRWIATQDQKNQFLKSEIALLDKDIAEIKRLKEQADLMVSRNRVIESLQATRSETVYIFAELARQVPEGIYLKNVKQSGRGLAISGFTQADSRISELMRSLDASPVFERPVLVDIRAVANSRPRRSEFNLRINISQQTAPADEKSGAAKPGGKP